MNWNKQSSIVLSLVCTGLFAALLLALDIGAYWICRWFAMAAVTLGAKSHIYLLLATVYSCSVFAWIILYSLLRLLLNIRSGSVFTDANTRYMRCTSWSCIAVAVICLLSAIYYVPFLLVAVAAAFMGLIVRIVKNCFAQAIAMKQELDLTV